MSAPLIPEWIAKAEQDWQAALQLLANRPEVVPDVIAFHAQQSAEKYLKALLLQAGEDPPPIHSLGAVLDLVILHHPEGEALREDAESLSPFAVRFRYPGYSLTVDKAREAVERARRIRAAIRSQLGLPP
jgi:HEPN domain-containing protein